MILTLTENSDFKRNFKNLFGIFENKVDIENKIFEKIQIKNISIKKKVSSNYIKKITGSEVKVVLCQNNLKLLKKNDFKTYRTSEEFLINLCTNTFFKILGLSKAEPSELNLAVFDPQGHCVDLIKKFIFYSKSLTVISNNLGIYQKEQDHLLKNYGATFFVSNDLNYLFKEKIIFAPKKINIKLPLKKGSIVFTSSKACYQMNGIIYNEYKLKKTKKLEKILPEGISSECFLSALYDVYNIKKIKNLVPDFCFNGIKYESVGDVSRKLRFL